MAIIKILRAFTPLFRIIEKAPQNFFRPQKSGWKNQTDPPFFIPKYKGLKKRVKRRKRFAKKRVKCLCNIVCTQYNMDIIIIIYARAYI